MNRIDKDTYRLCVIDACIQDLDGVSFEDCTFLTPLSGNMFRRCNFIRCKMLYTPARRAVFDWCNFDKTDMRFSYLFDTVFRHCILRYTNFQGAHMEGSRIIDSDTFNMIGNGREVKTYDLGFSVRMYDETIEIGCKTFGPELFSMSDSDIAELDTGALEWWKRYREFIKGEYNTLGEKK